MLLHRTPLLEFMEYLSRSKSSEVPGLGVLCILQTPKPYFVAIKAPISAPSIESLNPKP